MDESRKRRDKTPSIVLRGNRLLSVVLTSILLAGATILVREPDDEEAVSFPARATAAAETIASSPANPDAYLALAELALDHGGEQRVELWRRSVAAARKLAPSTDLPDRALLRGGFLHWHELQQAEQELVLESAGRLLSDPEHYRVLWQPVLQATRAPSFLARHSPDDQITRRQIRDLAATWEDHGTYLFLQRQTSSSLRPAVKKMDERELVDLLTRLERSSAYVNDAAIVFKEIESREENLPADLRKRMNDLALRWHSLLPEVERAIPDEQIEGLPQLGELKLPSVTTVPSLTIWRLPDERPSRIEVAAGPSGETPGRALLEVWVDGMLRESRLVDEQSRFEVSLYPGDQIFELRLANPRTRNNQQRRLQVRLER